MQIACQSCKLLILTWLHLAACYVKLAAGKKDPMLKLKEWFLDNQRDLPWRQNRTPYRVWISEVMLQQTQVAVVLPYYLRWMQKFPTVESLAAASLEEIIKAWEGLGYYSRARNLHRAAKQIVEVYGGILPRDRKLLAELPGFGPYTVGAVLSFAFYQKAPAVDGNAIRVLARYFGSERVASDRSHFESLALSILPDLEPWVVMEAVIELGATVCKKRPLCQECPLLDGCRAYRDGSFERLPLKKPMARAVFLERKVAIIEWGDEVLVRQEKGKRVMEGLYEFPYTSLNQDFDLGLDIIKDRDLPLVKHGFTKYNVTLYPAIYRAKEKKIVEGFEWRSKKNLEELPFSSGHRRIKHAYITH